MSKPRMIYPCIFSSDDFLSLSHGARLLFIGMFTLADDTGRGRGAPRVLQGAVFPGDKLPRGQIEAWSDEITARGMARFYEVQGSPYYDIPNWTKWQRQRYVRDSKIPPPNPQVQQNQGLPQSCAKFPKISASDSVSVSVSDSVATATAMGSAAEPPRDPGPVRKPRADHPDVRAIIAAAEEASGHTASGACERHAAKLVEQGLTMDVLSALRAYGDSCKRKGTSLEYRIVPHNLIGRDQRWREFQNLALARECSCCGWEIGAERVRRGLEVCARCEERQAARGPA